MERLDFEKPIADLEDKLAEMKTLAAKNEVDLQEPIEKLESKILSLKEEIFSNLTRWQKVQLARHPQRPYTLDYIAQITDNFIELHGDRNVADDKAMVGGIGDIDGKTFVFIGQQKGRNTKERQMRNFAMANPEGYRKALRLMKLAEKFGKPVVTFIDTPGAFPGIEAEKRGQAEAIARNLQEMFLLKVPIICIIIGEGASGGALGIGVGDKVFMLQYAWYSVISPENCSAILWRTWDFKEQAADALKLTSEDMKALGLIDGIVEEPLGGAHQNPTQIAQGIKKLILEECRKLEKISPKKRIENREKKLMKMGVYQEESKP